MKFLTNNLIPMVIIMRLRDIKNLLFLLLFYIITLYNYSYSQTTVFSDNFESGVDNWTFTGTWGLTSSSFYSSSNSLSESPTGNYTNMQSSTVTIKNNLDLSSYLGAEISFWCKFNIETAFDYVYLEISKDGGSSFVQIDEYTGIQTDWTKLTYNIGSFAGYSDVKIRFRFFSDQAVVKDGMFIDDMIITASNSDDSAPLIVFNKPLFYEGVQGDYILTSSITDVSGVSSATLYYFVDGSGPHSLNGIYISGDNYSFTIPSQTAGSHVSYKIKAVDNSINLNESDTSTVGFSRFIFGSYLSYDDAGVDALAAINGIKMAAVKITIPSGKYGQLVTALIRNYTDENNINDDMLFHVWENNNGMPGNDLITPFLVSPEADLNNPYPFTRIDLRSYSSELMDLTGDFFIGISVPQNTVNLLVSNTANNRSYSFDGTSWSNYSKTYEMRSVIHESSTPLPVELSTFNVDMINNSVSLSWETATEVNNYGFEVERALTELSLQNESINNKDGEWEKIAFVEGHGNSNSPKYYLYKDNSLFASGKYFYRLKQIDIDGTFEYSDIVEINFEAPNDFMLGQNYPNPFNPATKIEYSISASLNSIDLQNVTLKIYDILGREVITLIDEIKKPGIYEVNWDARNQSSGIYYYKLEVNNFIQIRKMNLVK